MIGSRRSIRNIQGQDLQIKKILIALKKVKLDIIFLSQLVMQRKHLNVNIKKEVHIKNLMKKDKKKVDLEKN